MELIKKIKTTPKNMEMLFDLGSVVNLRYYEIMNFEGTLSDFQYEILLMCLNVCLELMKN